MSHAASRMISLGNPPEDAQPASSIFASAAGLASSIEHGERFRIAVYPIISDAIPDVAMGIASCLCYLLEQFHDLKAYRCFARIDLDDASDEITSDDYQFSPDQWELDGLDDNIVLCGQLADTNAGLELKLFLDKSLADGEAEDEHSYRAATLNDIINRLPEAAGDVAEAILGQRPRQLILDYPPVSSAPAHSETLESVFGWNLDLYLHMWDVEWTESEIRSQYREFIDTSRRCADGFVYWCLGMISQQVLQYGLEEIGEVILPLLHDAIEAEPYQAHGAAAIATGLGRVAHLDRALGLVETFLPGQTEASVWNAAIELYLDAGQHLDAIDACQRALESGVEHPALYWRYVELLQLVEANDLVVPDVLFIDPDQVDEEDEITWETIGALGQILRLDPADTEASLQIISQLIDLEDDTVWDYFERLVKLDPVAPYISEVIEQLVDTEELGPAYEILKSAADDTNKSYVFASLAQLAIVDQDIALAEKYLDDARQSFTKPDDDLELELQRLELLSAIPDFEARFAETKLMLNAQRPVGEKDVDLLETAIEIAPRLVDTYITLARVYVSWRDSEGAREVLLEGQARAGEHPRITLGLVQALWNGGRRDEAIQQLNDGIASYPNEIVLLAQMASYLIENGQLDDARQYMERAESIAPSSRAVSQLRGLIARKLAE